MRILGVLTGYRADLVAYRVRMINRLRNLLTSVFPALEHESDFTSCKGALVLLNGYATLRPSAGWAKPEFHDGRSQGRSSSATRPAWPLVRG